jgi:hypothetical protein
LARAKLHQRVYADILKQIELNEVWNSTHGPIVPRAAGMMSSSPGLAVIASGSRPAATCVIRLPGTWRDPAGGFSELLYEIRHFGSPNVVFFDNQ